MNERVARLWTASEAISIGHSGVAIVARATGMAPRRIGLGKRELQTGVAGAVIVNVRRQGGGRRRKISAKEMKSLHIERDSFHGHWNYTLRPRVDAT
jgi:hypothetical protein